MVAENVLQSRTESSAKRVGRELILRLQALSNDELVRMVSATVEGRKVWLWIAVCRSYRLIREFAVEVVRERYLSGNREPLGYGDFDAFYERKAWASDELSHASELTRRKIRQKAFRLLAEAGLVTDKRNVQGVLIDEKTLAAIPAEEYMYFPMYVR